MKYFQNFQNFQNFQSFQAVDLGDMELGWAGPLAGLTDYWTGFSLRQPSAQLAKRVLLVRARPRPGKLPATSQPSQLA